MFPREIETTSRNHYSIIINIREVTEVRYRYSAKINCIYGSKYDSSLCSTVAVGGNHCYYHVNHAMYGWV